MMYYRTSRNSFSEEWDFVLLEILNDVSTELSALRMKEGKVKRINGYERRVWVERALLSTKKNATIFHQMGGHFIFFTSCYLIT